MACVFTDYIDWGGKIGSCPNEPLVWCVWKGLL